MSVINLYTLPDCPRCKVLKDICEHNEFIAENDFEVCEVNPNDGQDPYMNLLVEKGITNMPVLLVNNSFMDFTQAVNFLRSK